jgi:hypothetical protein
MEDNMPIAKTGEQNFRAIAFFGSRHGISQEFWAFMAYSVGEIANNTGFPFDS